VESLALAVDEFPDMAPDEQHALLRHCVKMQEQYKRSRDVLLTELSAQSSELERLQAESHVLATSLQARSIAAI
jgi:hypothetical protein